MAEFDYERDLSIDPDALDVELLQQATLFYRYSKEAANMKLALAKAKELVDVTRAALEFQIRDDPEGFDIPSKVTESVINSAILLAGHGELNTKDSDANDKKRAITDFINARNELNQAILDYDYVQAGIKGVDHKRSSISDLVKLAQQGYFATPEVPRDLSKEAQVRSSRDEATSKSRKSSSGRRT